LAAAWIRDGAARFCEVYRAVLAEARRFGDLHRLLAEAAGRHGNARISAVV
jgi:hypothetical protein